MGQVCFPPIMTIKLKHLMSEKQISSIAGLASFSKYLEKVKCGKQITAIQKLFYAFLFSKGQIAVVTLQVLDKFILLLK